MTGAEQQGLFPDGGAEEGVAVVNERTIVRTQDGHRVVYVAGVVLGHYSIGDRMAEAHVMVSLVDQGWADQVAVARAFGCTTRTVRRHQRRFEDGGLVALGRPGGYPKGRPRVERSRSRLVSKLKAEGVATREIARRVGVSEKAIRKQLERLGWRPRHAEQVALPLEEPAPAADPNLSAHAGAPAETIRSEQVPAADPNLSASIPEPDSDAPLVVSFDTDPADRKTDRLLACLGLLEDAAPLFRDGEHVPHAGVLLAMPALVHSGVLTVAREVYGSIAPAFYGLRTTVVALLLLALLRIKRPEALKEHSPPDLGRVLGLDRAPEVKTLRRKLARLAAFGRATEFGHRLAQRRAQTHRDAMGFLYVDGHVRVYNGQRSLPKTHVARMRICMPATTDYWVNDAQGDPLFVITAEANAGLLKMLPSVLDNVRTLVGDRRVTIAFDRGGWSPQLFLSLIADGFDILTYRKGRCRRVPRRCFGEQSATIDGRESTYTLADQEVRLLHGKLRLRQVTRLADDKKHQTAIITSRRDLSAVEVAYRMFERWRQENFFKYLREEYALDALVDYDTQPADATREVPNPVWNKVDIKLREARALAAGLSAACGMEAITNDERKRRTMRGFKIANARITAPLYAALRRCARLEAKRSRIPRRVPVAEVVPDGVVIKLATERKHLSNVLKTVAYQAESSLVRGLAPHYRRVVDEGRTLVQTALAAPADIKLTDSQIQITLAPLSSPHRSQAVAALCRTLNQQDVCFPGTRLRLHYAVAGVP
ncbi:MAG TPA: helix-turn-helix domain-containing protein [Rubrivivax sp.]|nr:helix-turn-helix domain-containing protein [Rubrivivax sp.]